MLTQADMRNILRHRCEEAGGQGKFAESIGISPQYLSDILNGKRAIGAMLAGKIGYERKIVFTPCDNTRSGT